jgi:hypothetical protein
MKATEKKKNEGTKFNPTTNDSISTERQGNSIDSVDSSPIKQFLPGSTMMQGGYAYEVDFKRTESVYDSLIWKERIKIRPGTPVTIC